MSVRSRRCEPPCRACYCRTSLSDVAVGCRFCDVAIFPRGESRRLRRRESDNPKRFANDAMDGYSALFRTIKSICLHRLYMAIQVTRTYIGSIQNQRRYRVVWIRSVIPPRKSGNVARWTADRIWDETGKIPDVSVLKAYMKNQACWKDLNAQSGQKVVEELSDFPIMVRPAAERRHGESSRLPQTRRRTTAQYGRIQRRVQTRPRQQPRPTLEGSNLKGVGQISCCANTRPALTLISQKSTRYRTFVRSGTVTITTLRL